jgi:sarcosine oxidase subunit gamma
MPYDAQLERLPIYALFDLKGAAKNLAAWVADLPDFPKTPNTLTRSDRIELCYCGPEHWLLRADINREEELLTMLRPDNAPTDINIVLVSDTLTFFRVTGPDASEILSIGCPLDVHESAFGNDAVSYTEFFGVKALVLRCEGGFECAIEQSFGDMVADYLSRALR